jgi:hypothetical protein
MRMMKMINFVKGFLVSVLILCANMVFAETFAGNVYLGDVGHGYSYAGFGHKDITSTLAYAMIQSSDGAYTLINKKDTAGGYIGFRVNNADKMVILNNGNVGIGTTTPESALRIWRNPGQGDAMIAITGGSCNTLCLSEGDTNNVAYIKYDGTDMRIGPGNADALNMKVTAGGAYVGIGTTTPDYPLTVKGGSGMYSIMATDGTTRVGIATNGTSGWFGTNTNSPLIFATNNMQQMTLDTSGNLAIGINYATAKLDVVNGAVKIRGTGAGLTITDSSTFGFVVSSPSSGQVRLKTDAANRWISFADGIGTTDVMSIKNGSVCIGTTTPQSGKALTVTGSGYFTGIVTTGSSRSLKHDIEPLSTTDALDALKALEPMRFKYNASDDDEKLGFISEDVPGLVAEKDRKSLNPMDFIAVAISVIKDQQARIEDQAARIEKLERAIEQLTK